MSIILRVELIITAVCIFVAILYSIRHHKFEVQDSIIWLFIALSLVLASLLPQVIIYLSNLVGIEVPSNLVFYLGIIILLMINFYQTIRLSQQERKVRRLIQEISILKGEEHEDK